jgi:TfoX/Sxy family transcriptional regulator of competence genes
MPYSEELADRVRILLSTTRKVEEKKMMGGLTFMVNDKMCVGILGDDLMARIDPEIYHASLERQGCREMNFTGKPMKGFVFVDKTGTHKNKDLQCWIHLALDYNKKAKASKKRNRLK